MPWAATETADFTTLNEILFQLIPGHIPIITFHRLRYIY